MPKAVWNGVILADATPREVLFVDNRYYFPPWTVDGRYLARSNYVATCPWKGQETHFHVIAQGQTLRNAVQAYYHPYPGYEFLKGYLAFKEGVRLYE